MNILDVNVLVYAMRSDSAHHTAAKVWLENTLLTDAIALSDIVCSGYLRVVTNAKIFKNPTPIERAIAMIDELRNHPSCTIINPSEQHFSIFTALCRKVQATGNLIPDAYIAALAIEHNCSLITADQGFKRFPALRFTTPW